MEILQGVWKQRLRRRAVMGYGIKIFLPSPPNYVTRSPGSDKIVVMPYCIGWVGREVGMCFTLNVIRLT